MWLYKGERKAKRRHTCDDCDRPICPTEYYYVEIGLIRYDDGEREVTMRKLCVGCRKD